MISVLGLGLYDRRQRLKITYILTSLLIAVTIASAASLSATYLIFYEVFGRLTLLYGASLAFIGNLSIKLLIALLLRRNPYRFTFLGSSNLSAQIVRHFQSKSSKHTGYKYIPFDDSTLQQPHEDVLNQLLIGKVGDLILTKSVLDDPELVELSILAVQARIRLITETDFYIQTFERIPIDHISKRQILVNGLAQRKILTTLSKRVFDIISASVALVITSPFLLLIAFAIKTSSRGPVFFTQKRQGRYFKSFNIYKFRTMKTETCDKEGSSGFVKKNDSRVTWVGKLLRRLHFDELPQLLNIIKGEMSVVGPRPEALDFAMRMKAALPIYEMRYLIRPGLTGLAQLNQGYAMDSIEDVKVKLSYDLYYLMSYNFIRDIVVIIRTIFFLARGSR